MKSMPADPLALQAWKERKIARFEEHERELLGGKPGPDQSSSSSDSRADHGGICANDNAGKEDLSL